MFSSLKCYKVAIVTDLLFKTRLHFVSWFTLFSFLPVKEDAHV